MLHNKYVEKVKNNEDLVSNVISTFLTFAEKKIEQ